MTPLNTDFFFRCISTLERAFTQLQTLQVDDGLYDIYRAACVKEFEIILEQAGKLLKKCLKPYFSSPKQVDQLTFKDLFRHAAKHGLLELEEAERWLFIATIAMKPRMIMVKVLPMKPWPYFPALSKMRIG